LASLYPADLSLGKCEDARLFREQREKLGDVFPPFQEGQEYFILEKLVFQKNTTVCAKCLFALYPL